MTLGEGSGLVEGQAVVLVSRGIGFGEIGGECVEFSSDLGAGDPGLHAADDSQPVKGAGAAVGNVDRQFLHVAERHPELRGEQEIDAAESGRSNAHDGEGMSGEREGLADDRRVGSETTLPQAVAEDYDLLLFFGWQKAAAERHTNLGDVEEVAGGGLPPDALWLTVSLAAPNPGHGSGKQFVVSRDSGEGFGVVAHIEIERPGVVIAAALAACLHVQ